MWCDVMWWVRLATVSSFTIYFLMAVVLTPTLSPGDSNPIPCSPFLLFPVRMSLITSPVAPPLRTSSSWSLWIRSCQPHLKSPKRLLGDRQLINSTRTDKPPFSQPLYHPVPSRWPLIFLFHHMFVHIFIFSRIVSFLFHFRTFYRNSGKYSIASNFVRAAEEIICFLLLSCHSLQLTRSRLWYSSHRWSSLAITTRYPIGISLSQRILFIIYWRVTDCFSSDLAFPCATSATLMPEDRYLATYARSWLQSVTSVGKHTKNRTFKLFGMNNSGLNTFLPRFLSPQKPPKGFNSRRACIHLTSIVPYMDDAQVRLECTDISMIRHGEGICIYSMLLLHVQTMTSFSIDWNAIVS